MRIGIQRLVVSHVKRPDSVRIGALKDGQVGDVGRSWRWRLEIVRGSTEIGWFVGSSDNLRITVRQRLSRFVVESQRDVHQLIVETVVRHEQYLLSSRANKKYVDVVREGVIDVAYGYGDFEN